MRNVRRLGPEEKVVMGRYAFFITDDSGHTKPDLVRRLPSCSEMFSKVYEGFKLKYSWGKSKNS